MSLRQCLIDFTASLFQPHGEILHPLTHPIRFLSLQTRGSKTNFSFCHSLVTQIYPTDLADQSAKHSLLSALLPPLTPQVERL